MGTYFQAYERPGEHEQHAIAHISRARTKLPDSAAQSAGGQELTKHQALPTQRPYAADSRTAKTIRELP
jgi:hypothetical protein